MTEPRAKVCHYSEVEAEVFGDEAPGVTIRWVIDEKRDGAPIYALRVIEVARGAILPTIPILLNTKTILWREKGEYRSTVSGLRLLQAM